MTQIIAVILSLVLCSCANPASAQKIVLQPVPSVEPQVGEEVKPADQSGEPSLMEVLSLRQQAFELFGETMRLRGFTPEEIDAEIEAFGSEEASYHEKKVVEEALIRSYELIQGKGALLTGVVKLPKILARPVLKMEIQTAGKKEWIEVNATGSPLQGFAFPIIGVQPKGEPYVEGEFSEHYFGASLQAGRGLVDPDLLMQVGKCEVQAMTRLISVEAGEVTYTIVWPSTGLDGCKPDLELIKKFFVR